MQHLEKKMRPAYRKRQSKRVNMTPFPVPLLGLSCVLMSRPISPELVLLSDWSDSVSNMSKIKMLVMSPANNKAQGIQISSRHSSSLCNLSCRRRFNRCKPSGHHEPGDHVPAAHGVTEAADVLVPSTS